MPIRRASDNVYALAANATATGAAVAIPGGQYMFMVEGNPSGATISLQVQSPSGAWQDVQVFTGSIVKFTTLPGNQTAIDLPQGYVRLAVTGGTTPNGINAWLAGLG